MSLLNETHDPQLSSWVASANLPGTDFPIQNLPFAVFRRKGSHETFRGGVAIGDQVLDLAAVSSKNLFSGETQQAALAASGSTLNHFMAMGPTAWNSLRLGLSRLLREDAKQQAITSQCLVDMEDVEYALPAHIGDYTDFYTSIYHATNVGKLFRPDNPLLPNYRWVPIGYHGRASSVVLSGQSRHEYASLATALKRRAHGTGVKRRAEFVEHGVNARHGQCHLREITLVGLPPSAEQVRGTDK